MLKIKVISTLNWKACELPGKIWFEASIAGSHATDHVFLKSVSFSRQRGMWYPGLILHQRACAQAQVTEEMA